MENTITKTIVQEIDKDGEIISETITTVENREPVTAKQKIGFA